MGRLGRPGLGRPPGLAEFSAWRPSSGLGIVVPPSSEWGLLGSRDTPASFFLLLKVRWTREPPRLYFVSWGQGRGGLGVGDYGGPGRSGRPLYKKGPRRDGGTCYLHGLGTPGPVWGYGDSMTSSSEASIRLIKFAAAALAAEARGAGDLGERQSLGAGGPAPEREAGTHRQCRKQVYSYSNKPTNCTRQGEGASNRLARGPGAALHKAIFCVGASGAFACCGVISGFEKRTVARPHFPLWFRRRRKCFAGG